MKPATVPAIITIHADPDFAEATKTLERLKADRRERELQRSRLSEKRSAEIAESRIARRQRQAEALLKGEAIESIEASGILDKQVVEINREIPVFDEAILLAEQALQTAGYAATQQVHDAFRSRLQATNRKLFDALVDVGHAVMEVASVSREIEAATDGNPQWWRSPVLPWGALGRPDVEGSRIMRMLAVAVEGGYAAEEDVPEQWLKGWENWRFFRSRGQNGPLSGCEEPVMSDEPKAPKKVTPIQLPAKRDDSSPLGTVRVRFLQGAAGPGACFAQHAIADLPEAQARELLEADAVELFRGQATAVRHADLLTERADDEWRPAAA